MGTFQGPDNYQELSPSAIFLSVFSLLRCVWSVLCYFKGWSESIYFFYLWTGLGLHSLLSSVFTRVNTEKKIKTSPVSTVSSSDVTGAAAAVWDLPVEVFEEQVDCSGYCWYPAQIPFIRLVQPSPNCCECWLLRAQSWFLLQRVILGYTSQPRWSIRLH